MSIKNSPFSNLAIQEAYSLYERGYFAMAESRESEEFQWVAPVRRALIPIYDFKISRSLRKAMKKEIYEIRINWDFESVIAACAETQAQDRNSTWINHDIEWMFLQFHLARLAHSVEVYQEDKLMGGLYGLQIGSVFCGESMFSRKSNMSKFALVALVERLRAQKFQLLDAQFSNPHLQQFGVYEISQQDYEAKLHQLKNENCVFDPLI
jgi:leucyl/phenylalanyl-tRNA--protein transferase